MSVALQCIFHFFFFSVEVYRATDVCVDLQPVSGFATFADSVLADIERDSLGGCVGACTSTSGCTAVAVETQIKNSNLKGRCILASSGYTTTADPQFYLYDLII